MVFKVIERTRPQAGSESSHSGVSTQKRGATSPSQSGQMAPGLACSRGWTGCRANRGTESNPANPGHISADTQTCPGSQNELWARTPAAPGVRAAGAHDGGLPRPRAARGSSLPAQSHWPWCGAARGKARGREDRQGVPDAGPAPCALPTPTPGCPTLAHLH